MKKALLIFSVFCATGLFAQNYYVIRKTGSSVYDFNTVFATSGTSTILNKPSDDVMSAAQTIPFTFNFYGNPVTQYKASDNGYITFDVADNTSNKTATSLPDVAGPNNAIYAFWSSLELKAAPNANFPVKVLTWTLGTTPNRIHVIQYFGISRPGASIAGNADVISTAILLYEGAEGKFQVVNSGAYGGSAFKGTIGCENSDGSLGVNVAGAPTTSFVPSSSTSNLDNVVYEFIYGVQPAIDIAGISAAVKPIVKKTDNTPIAGNIANYGSTAITKMTINYSIDGAAPITQNKTGLNIAANGGTYYFSHSVPFTNGTAGQTYNISAWISNINDTLDQNPGNDTIKFSVFVNNGVVAPKKVLLEEGSGGWCGYCPDGHLQMTDILKNYSNVIGVVHHNSDGMTNAQSDIINSAYATAYPTAWVDRYKFEDKATVGFDRTGGAWEAKAGERMNAVVPCTVSISEKSFDPSTRKITFTVKVDYLDYYIGDMRLNAFVVEDKVRGANVNNTWTQHNYYSSQHSSGGVGGPSHPLYGEPEWMVGYFHNHVVRNIPSTAWGTSGVIPATVTPGSSYSQQYNYTLPVITNVTYTGTKNTTELWSTENGYGMNKPADVRLVGFVSMYDASTAKREVLNSIEIPLFDLANGIEENKQIEKAEVYPNPANGLTSVSFNVNAASNVKVEVINAVGQTVLTLSEAQFGQGTHALFFNTDNMGAGIYFVKVSTGNSVVTEKFSVVK